MSSLPNVPPASTSSYLLPQRLLVLSNTLGKLAARMYTNEFGVLLAEWRLLATVARLGETGVNELALQLATDNGGVSRTARSMFEKGWLEFNGAAHDGRRIMMKLSPEGRALYDSIRPAAVERNAELLAVLTSEEISTLDQTLEKLQRHAEGMLHVAEPKAKKLRRKR